MDEVLPQPPQNPSTAPAAAAPPATPAPLDPVVELERLREANRRWRRLGLAVGAAFVFLFVLSLVQFLGTIVACKLLVDARREAALVNQKTQDYVRQIRDHRSMQAASQRVTGAPAPPADERGAAPSARMLEMVVQTERLKEELARTEKALADAEKERGDAARTPALQTELQRLKKALAEAERELVRQEVERKTERSRIESEVMKKLRSEMNLPGHDPEKQCPFPLRKLFGPSDDQ